MALFLWSLTGSEKEFYYNWMFVDANGDDSGRRLLVSHKAKYSIQIRSNDCG